MQTYSPYIVKIIKINDDFKFHRQKFNELTVIYNLWQFYHRKSNKQHEEVNISNFGSISILYNFGAGEVTSNPLQPALVYETKINYLRILCNICYNIATIR